MHQDITKDDFVAQGQRIKEKLKDHSRDLKNISDREKELEKDKKKLEETKLAIEQDLRIFIKAAFSCGFDVHSLTDEIITNFCSELGIF